MINDCIIMAGGSGTRLWPASTSKRPKQFLPISRAGSGSQEGSGESTFFNEALERALALIDKTGDGQVIIIAGKGHVPHIIEACAQFDADDRQHFVLIPEPLAKNTAAAIACGIRYADLVFGHDRNMLVLTSDHIIQPIAAFKADVAAAEVFVRQDTLVVFGIPPQSPATGYGYIEAAELLSVPEDRQKVFRVASFREKPDRYRAEAFLASGRFYWNSGMFAFSSRCMLKEFLHHAPEVMVPFNVLPVPQEKSYTITRRLRILEAWPGLPEAYAEAQNISFDYAIAEKSERTVMVAAGFAWRDVGSWDEYIRLVGDTGSEVYCSGTPPAASGDSTKALDSSCFVDSDIPVALCGAEDLIVVVRSGKDGATPAVLIAKKGETQGVKEIVEKIKVSGRTELL